MTKLVSSSIVWLSIAKIVGASLTGVTVKIKLPDPEVFLDQQESQQKQIIGKIYRHYQKTMKGCNAIDFDDILNLTLSLYDKCPEVMDSLTERFRYIMVDEYQDTNRIQYKLLRHLTKQHRNLCVVGDDDQSIYGWRGAEVRNIFEFEEDFPEVIFFRPSSPSFWRR